MGCFASSPSDVSNFEAELSGLILAMKFAVTHACGHLWLESNSTSVLLRLRILTLLRIV